MEHEQLKKIIIEFLNEDIGGGDITSSALFSRDQMGEASFVAKEPFICAGISSVAAQVFFIQNPDIEIVFAAEDGSRAVVGEPLFTVRGPVLDLLKAERVSLNLAQRLCGIATMTSRFVEAVKPLPVRIVDTRKTTPGLRSLEKYAVRVGGGFNHRFNLADGVLIKDNHIAACGSIQEAVKRVREQMPHTLKIEVEASNVQQVRECLSSGVDIIMLDNMDIPSMREAVMLAGGKALLEASGGMNLNDVREVAETGVDIISVGGLTHSAPACDISMRLKDV